MAEFLNHPIRALTGEKCGIIGVWGHPQAPFLTSRGLVELTHRGQDSTGLVTRYQGNLISILGDERADQFFSRMNPHSVSGFESIGHVRYATSGGTSSEHIQPFVAARGRVALAHNGNLPEIYTLARKLENRGISVSGKNDSALMAEAIGYHMLQGARLEDAIQEATPHFKGAFSLVLLDQQTGKVAAVRDGMRPLSIGQLNQGFALASETCALEGMGARFLRDVAPGELVIADENGLTSYDLDIEKHGLDIWEIFYSSHPDSRYFNRTVRDMRFRSGTLLAHLYRDQVPVDINMVVPIPKSSIPAAQGFAQALGVSYLENGLLIRDPIIRSFIQPDQATREQVVKSKLEPNARVLQGRNIGLIDDSIVRGTTSKFLIERIKQAGASVVTMLVASPPIRYSHGHGVDIVPEQLIAHNRTIDEVGRLINADRLFYLPLEELLKATGQSPRCFSTPGFTPSPF